MEKLDYHDVDRRNMSHNDTDARYSGGRRVEKYDRPGGKGADYPGMFCGFCVDQDKNKNLLMSQILLQRSQNDEERENICLYVPVLEL